MSAAGQAVFGTVERTDPLGFRTPKGLNYDRVRQFLNLTSHDLASQCGVATQSVRFDERMPPDLREYVENLANICNLVAAHFDGDAERTALWFRTQNPMLGDVSPRDMLRLRRYQRLLKFVLAARAANPPGEPQAPKKRSQVRRP